ncbi:Gfo/Idh/MocA family oxidoreductase [Parabacteroides sp. PF5-9]|uniref:Gfo/Idh/MocA family protein n=1 Tax=Parabacteroides sp. PF5-9 TaxID=1742404 RepID=UPI002475EB58|nr:Gfo/Idh/MocA family oxidoreductase [Parabacteroides sp. PF5-9]
MDTVKWGIIGAGDVCEKKSGPAFYKTAHSELIAVMRRDEEKAKDYALRHNVPKYYTDVERLIHDPDVNAIYVATPPDSHAEYAIKALKAGKPVYVEKPMAMSYLECMQMIKASEISGQKLFVAYYRRALPYFRKIKELLDRQLIGTPLTVDVKYFRTPSANDLDPEKQTWRVQRATAGEGYFYDMAPHTLDILAFLLGEITEAKGCAQNLGHYYEVKDTISAVWQFESGAIGTGQWCFVTSEKSEWDYVVITGTKGEIRFNTFAFNPIKLITPDYLDAIVARPPECIQQPLIQTIVDELRGVGQCPSTGITGARTSRVMDMILGE